MIKRSLTVFCPATVSNVGPGFDLLGFALEQPGDRLIVRRNDEGILRLIDESGTGLPTDPEKNVAAIAVKSLLEGLQEMNMLQEQDAIQDQGTPQGQETVPRSKAPAGESALPGFDLVFSQKINPGSGLGSSAASSVAAVVGVNELLGAPLTAAALLPYAMEGEEAASGSYHADNVAPALLGGFTLIRGYDPLDIKHIPYPADLYCAVVHPDLQFNTREGRKVIPSEVPLQTAVAQAGNLAGLIAGLTTNDYGLISRSVTDLFAEPYRTGKLPAYGELKKNCLAEGALGTGLSGSGPSLFSLCRGEEIARSVAKVMEEHFRQHGIGCLTYISRVSEAGCRIATEDTKN